LRGVPEDDRDGVGVVELPGGDADHQVVGLVVGQGQPWAVKAWLSIAVMDILNG
jgi:hypothetical protein